MSSGSPTAGRAFHFKLVVVGDSSVGKSSLALRFAKGEFDEAQEPSIGASFMTQIVALEDCTVKFEIWDTAGQERYKALAPMYYRGSAVAVVVFDITNKESFDNAKAWVSELRSTEALIVLAGNKSDLGASGRTVAGELAMGYAEIENILYMETSAKTGSNVTDLFTEIAKRLPKKNKEDLKEKGKFKVGAEKPAPESDSCCT
mmetsp:Transcript_102732/g.306929  ORF Transcript_102732/g.306929 Transcript_102732/m.306929 type:complete len:203 (-) Transcript_102732:36-644(-)